jgi:hypothetical protein
MLLMQIDEKIYLVSLKPGEDRLVVNHKDDVDKFFYFMLGYRY